MRQRLLTASAATLDRLLQPNRTPAARRLRRRRQQSLGRNIPVRTFADWNAPPPGHLEIDLVVHHGGSLWGSMIHGLVATDICTGWTEAVPLLAREQLFPILQFRLTYDALREWRGERADVEYVRILHLAATTMEATVDSALSLLLEAGQPFDYGEVRDLAEPKVPEAPLLTLSGQPDLKVYDRLLKGSLATAGVCA